MSLAPLLGQASAVYSAVNQIFGLSGSVRLGSVVLTGVEIPDTIRWGGRQHITRQELPGGVVNMSAMGIRFEPIKWHGYFEGFGALARSQQFYTMLNAAKLLPLSWNGRSYTVLMSEFQADDTQPNWIPYAITLDVLRDETLAAPAAKPGLLSQITGDITSAQGITPATMATVQTALGQAQTAVRAVGAVTGGSGAALALAGALTSAQGAISDVMAAANGSIGGLIAGAASLGSVIPAGNAAAGAGSISTAVAAATALAVAPVAQGLIGRAQTNLANASP